MSARVEQQQNKTNNELVDRLMTFSVSFTDMDIDVRLTPNVGQNGAKWDKFGTFSDQILVHFGSMSQNVLKSDQKKSRICPG